MNVYRHTVLCVDDDAHILHSLKRLLRKENYLLLTAISGAAALKILEESHVDLVVSDQRMPEMNGTEFLAIIREKYPDIIRIVLTGYTEVDSITESINKGHIYKFILKPWNDQNLKLEIKQGLQQYDLVQSNRMLHEKVIQQIEGFKKLNKNMEDLVKKRTKELETQNQALELSHAALEELPFPVIGISSAMLIALINSKAQALSFNNGSIKLGDRFSDYFPSEVEKKVRNVFATANNDSIKKFRFAGMVCDMDLISLSEKVRDKGVVLLLKPEAI
jgi:CheY-like chemotaxis protein